MSKLLSIRMDDREKKLMNFSSKMTRTPVSKLVSDYILDGARISLGSAILFHMDRTTIFSREAYNKFMRFLRSSRSSDSGSPDEYENLFELSPGIIWDFFDLISEQKAKKRLRSIFEGVEIGEDLDYMEPKLIEDLCRTIGSAYVSEGGSLNKLDRKLALKVCFHQLMHLHYRNNARGTVKTLNSQWYTNRNSLSRMEDDLITRYEKRMERRVVEAVEVRDKDERERRALPPSDQVTAKVISERPKRKKKKIRK